MFFEQYSHEPYLAVVRFWLAYSGDAGEVRRPDSRVGRRAGTRRSTRWSATSPDEAFFVAERYTIADIALYAYTHVAHEGEFDLGPYPATGSGSGESRPSRGTSRSTLERVDKRVRFAPSPTGSLHVGNALTAVANRRFADEHGGVLVLRIDDTDPTRTVEGGEAAILEDLAWLGISFDEGPLRQSERGALYADAAGRALAASSAERDGDGAVRLARDGTTLQRADGSATY